MLCVVECVGLLLRLEDVESAVDSGRSTVTEADIGRYIEWQEQFGNEAR